MKLDRVIAVRNDKIIYRDGDKCIKVFNEDYSKGDVLNEALNQARMEETGLYVPKFFEVSIIEGKLAIISEYIKGKTLAQLIKEEPEKRDEYFEQFVDLQLSIHEKKCPLLFKLKDKMDYKIGISELDAMTRYDLHTRLDAMPKHNKVCHGDFNLSNVVITEDGIPYVLDWAHVTKGNASADAACTYLRFWLNNDMEGAKKYLDLFTEKSDITKRYVQKWMPIVAAAQSVKGNKKQREFMLSWENVIDYE